MTKQSKTTLPPEWEGYASGLRRALNMKPRVPRGDEGTRVLNDLRDQIMAEIARVEAEHGKQS